MAEVITGEADIDVVFAKKDDDAVSGIGGDDWLCDGHGDEVLDGGAGSDVLEYTLSEKLGEANYSGDDKGNDTLRLTLTSEEFAELAEEPDSFEAWIAEIANTKNSAGHAFNDESVSSDKHPIFETYFGLNIRNIENLEFNVLEDEPKEEPKADPAGEDSGHVVVDLTTETYAIVIVDPAR